MKCPEYGNINSRLMVVCICGGGLEEKAIANSYDFEEVLKTKIMIVYISEYIKNH